MDLELNNKVAVVTGASKGIGLAVTKTLAGEGALVVAGSRTVDSLTGLERVTPVAVDLIDPGGPGALVARAVEAHGRVDVLVNNVGDYRPLVRFEDSTPESWHDMYTVNLMHVFAVTRAFIGPMTERGSGSIVNIHSVEGLRGFPGEPVYAAMKAAVAHFTTSLAVAVGRSGVRVNGIGPDLTQSPQVDYLSGFEEHDDLWSSWAPVGRLGWPEDQARAALFLASDQSGFVTGTNLPVDGGTRAAGGWFFSPKAGRFVNRPTTL
jgi:NAD(P)-dependent dehydrogenase (short-subunit alcohol dehydrogenase family)